MSASATPADAEIVLKLYDLRREAEMRKARAWITGEFWPDTADDVIKVGLDFGSQHNAWYRQVTTYWNMAAALVLRGAVSRELFVDFGGEMFFLFAKFEPFVKAIREKFNAPEFLENIEKVVDSTPGGRERIARLQERIKFVRQLRAQAAKG